MFLVEEIILAIVWGIWIAFTPMGTKYLGSLFSAHVLNESHPDRIVNKNCEIWKYSHDHGPYKPLACSCEEACEKL